MQNFRALGALPPDPQPPAAGASPPNTHWPPAAGGSATTPPTHSPPPLRISGYAPDCSNCFSGIFSLKENS